MILRGHELFRLRNNEGLDRSELLDRKLFPSSDTNHVIKVLRDSEEMISFKVDTFDLIKKGYMNDISVTIEDLSRPDYLR